MVFLLLFVVELVILLFTSRLLTTSLSRFLQRLFKNQTITIQLLALLFLPGVVIHELSHLLTASLLLVPVGEIEFMPQITEDGVKLGSVAIARTDPVRRAIIGVSPVLIGLVILIGSLFYFTQNILPKPPVAFWQIALLLYVLFEVGNTMFSSRKDVEGTLETVIVISIIALVLYIAGFRIPISALSIFSSSAFLEFFKTADMFLFVPLAIDGILCGVIKMLIKS